jgi:ferredoxin-NADP reductase
MVIPSRDEGRDALVVLRRNEIAERVIELELARPQGERLPDWTPGSHIDLVLPTGLSRQYSLCGDPADVRTYTIAVQREAAGEGGSRWIHDELQVGDTVRFGGPRNTFSLVPGARHAFLAGGIGITPIVSMLRAAQQLGSDWSLLYLGRSRSAMAYAEPLIALGDRVTLHPADERGPADLAGWAAALDPDAKLYACGPERLLQAVEAIGSGRLRGSVRVERFAARTVDTPPRRTPYVVECARQGVEVEIAPTSSIAEGLQAAGIRVLTSCGRGVCGTCLTDVLAGVPDHRDTLLDDDERAAGDCLFPCVSRSRSARLVLDL